MHTIHEPKNQPSTDTIPGAAEITGGPLERPVNLTPAEADCDAALDLALADAEAEKAEAANAAQAEAFFATQAKTAIATAATKARERRELLQRDLDETNSPLVRDRLAIGLAERKASIREAWGMAEADLTYDEATDQVRIPKGQFDVVMHAPSPVVAWQRGRLAKVLAARRDKAPVVCSAVELLDWAAHSAMIFGDRRAMEGTAALLEPREKSGDMPGLDQLAVLGINVQGGGVTECRDVDALAVYAVVMGMGKRGLKLARAALAGQSPEWAADWQAVVELDPYSEDVQPRVERRRVQRRLGGKRVSIYEERVVVNDGKRRRAEAAARASYREWCEALSDFYKALAVCQLRRFKLASLGAMPEPWVA